MKIQNLVDEHSQACNISNYLYKPGFYLIYLCNAQPPPEQLLHYSLWKAYNKRTFELIEEIHKEVEKYDH